MVSRKLLTLKNTTEELNMLNDNLPRSGSARVRFLVEAAVIAALYTVLTYVAAAMNLAYGIFQFRFPKPLPSCRYLLRQLSPAWRWAVCCPIWQARLVLWTGFSEHWQHCWPLCSAMPCGKSRLRAFRYFLLCRQY